MPLLKFNGRNRPDLHDEPPHAARPMCMVTTVRPGARIDARR